MIKDKTGKELNLSNSWIIHGWISNLSSSWQSLFQQWLIMILPDLIKTLFDDHHSAGVSKGQRIKWVRQGHRLSGKGRIY